MRPTLVLGVASFTALAGCAAGLNFERESARAISPTPYPDSVTISDVRTPFTGPVTWVATTANATYDCSKDAHERTAICAKRHP